MLRGFIGTRHEGGGLKRKRSAKKTEFRVGCRAAAPPWPRHARRRGGAGGEAQLLLRQKQSDGP